MVTGNFGFLNDNYVCDNSNYDPVKTPLHNRSCAHRVHTRSSPVSFHCHSYTSITDHYMANLYFIFEKKITLYRLQYADYTMSNRLNNSFGRKEEFKDQILQTRTTHRELEQGC